MYNTTDDFNKFLDDFGERASELGKDWLEYHRNHIEDWRSIVEKRSKDDSKYFKEWAKSWMSTGFQMLESEQRSINEFHKMQLKLIDSYIDSLDKSLDLKDAKAFKKATNE